MIRYAFYGRVSTEDQQDPAASRNWQRSRAESLIQQHGQIVAEFFDIGQSRSLPWKRRPEANALLTALKAADRGFDAVVIGEPHRAFYGNQFGLVFPLFVHSGAELWVPEVGGPIDPNSEAHDLIMSVFGGMSKGERSRIKIRVRTAMAAQAKVEGRYLGGRPPYGYRITDAGPHPNPAKAADVVEQALRELRDQAGSLAALVDAHRGTVLAGRTLTQHAVPTTFGAKAAGWLAGVLDAADALARLSWPAQFGGAAGTLSAAVELARMRDAADPVAAVTDAVADAAGALGLRPVPPWHTTRTTFTAIGDALVAGTGAWGRIATDVAALSRSEIGELAEPAPGGRGGSSTMPQKRNPVLSVLIRRAALTAPPLAATLHLAAALAGDERPDGAWHAEWAALRDLARRTLVAASHTSELLRGLRVDDARMGATARAGWPDLTAERRSIAAFAGVAPADDEYVGAADAIVAAVLARAHSYLEAAQ
jgi:3-carboxy-cis,cis-muconate cycloisomerase